MAYFSERPKTHRLTMYVNIPSDFICARYVNAYTSLRYHSERSLQPTYSPKWRSLCQKISAPYTHYNRENRTESPETSGPSITRSCSLLRKKHCVDYMNDTVGCHDVCRCNRCTFYRYAIGAVDMHLRAFHGCNREAFACELI